jgi:hypothetical protein
MILIHVRRAVLRLATFGLCLILQTAFASADTQAIYEAARKEGPMT